MESPILRAVRGALRSRRIVLCPDFLVVQYLTGQCGPDSRATANSRAEFKATVRKMRVAGGAWSLLLFVDVSRLMLPPLMDRCEQLDMYGFVIAEVGGVAAKVQAHLCRGLAGEDHRRLRGCIHRVCRKALSIEDTPSWNLAEWQTSLLADCLSDDRLDRRYHLYAECIQNLGGAAEPGALANAMKRVDGDRTGVAHVTVAQFEELHRDGAPLGEYLKFHDDFLRMALEGGYRDVIEFIETGQGNQYPVFMYSNRSLCPVACGPSTVHMKFILILVDENQIILNARVIDAYPVDGDFQRAIARNRAVSDIIGTRFKKERKKNRNRGIRNGKAKSELQRAVTLLHGP